MSRMTGGPGSDQSGYIRFFASRSCSPVPCADHREKIKELYRAGSALRGIESAHATRRLSCCATHNALLRDSTCARRRA
jgi:hypothetical protein